jgi:hypothetical protein
MATIIITTLGWNGCKSLNPMVMVITIEQVGLISIVSTMLYVLNIRYGQSPLTSSPRAKSHH